MSAKIELDEDHIVISVSKGFVYPISIDQIERDHTNGRMDWIYHLSQKPWWTAELDAEFKEIFFELDLPFYLEKDPNDAA